MRWISFLRKMARIITERTLLLRACDAGAFGRAESIGSSKVSHALFTFPEGDVCEEVFERIELAGMHLVCLERAWAGRLERMGLKTYTRWHMQPQEAYRTDACGQLPEGYALHPFDEAAFAEKPFGHGAQYRDYADFAARGAGAVVRHEGKIVAAASSFLTHGKEVEMDISTDEGHRRKGLACACAAAMLKDCMERGITVHWDAQNEASRRLALRLGYEVGCEYDVFLG